jgi:hypothetical protein
MPTTSLLLHVFTFNQSHNLLYFASGFHSGLRALTNGTVKLIWDNSGSMFTSKTIEYILFFSIPFLNTGLSIESIAKICMCSYSVESKPFVPQSNFGAEVLEPIRALQRARTASQEQQVCLLGFFLLFFPNSLLC